MADIKIKLNSAGVQEMLKSVGAQSVCAEHAKRVLARCGDGYEMDTYIGQRRVNCGVYPATAKAYYKNLKENTLLKALGGG